MYRSHDLKSVAVFKLGRTCKVKQPINYPVGIYLFKVNNRKYFTSCFGVSVVNFEQVNADWDRLCMLSFSM